MYLEINIERFHNNIGKLTQLEQFDIQNNLIENNEIYTILYLQEQWKKEMGKIKSKLEGLCQITIIRYNIDYHIEQYLP